MIEILQSTISDNFFYLVESEGEIALIDPIDAAVAIEAAQRHGANVRYVLNTHFHPDHIGGNRQVLGAFSDATLVCGPDAERVPDVDQVVAGGDEIPLGDGAFSVIETPGHTEGHVAFLWGDELFIGDALFIAGTGHCKLGGDPTTLFYTFRDVISKLPQDLRFYAGHNYAQRNLEFAAAVQPERDFSAFIEKASKEDPPIWTIGENREVNPFQRTGESELQDAVEKYAPDLFAEKLLLSNDRDEATFRTLRELRNRW